MSDPGPIEVGPLGVMRRWRDRADARALERAVRVFEQRGWLDAPGRYPVVADTLAHLRYRARTLREAS